MHLISVFFMIILASCTASPTSAPVETDLADVYVKQAGLDIPREYSSITVSKVEKRDKNLVTTMVFFDNQPVTIHHLTAGMAAAKPDIRREHHKMCNDEYFLPLIALGYTFSVELIINPRVVLGPMTEENCIKQGYLKK